MNIDKEILYWIDQLGFECIDCDELIEHIKEHYVKNSDEVVDDFIWCMEWKVDKDYLNKEKICEDDDDYEYLGDDMYLNVYLLELDSLELKRLDLIE